MQLIQNSFSLHQRTRVEKYFFFFSNFLSGIEPETHELHAETQAMLQSSPLSRASERYISDLCAAQSEFLRIFFFQR